MKCTTCDRQIYGYAVLSPSTDKTKRHMCEECSKKIVEIKNVI